MKTKIKLICLLLMFGTCALITPNKAAAQEPVTFQVFYDELSPYGMWTVNPDFGYVWVPNVEPGFSPYVTDGYWMYTNVGWTWYSYFSWGWAPFHYGTWYTDPIYGPIWVPGYQWGPGWVAWRGSPNYYGWTPIGPGVSYDMAYSNSYNVPPNQWTFVSCNYYGTPNSYTYYESPANNTTIINNTTVINNSYTDNTSNVTYNSGPNPSEVAQHTGKPVTAVPITASTKPGQEMSNNQLSLYRPQVQQTPANGVKPAPAKVEDIKNVKTLSQRQADAKSKNANVGVKPISPQQKAGLQPVKPMPSQVQQNNQQLKQQPAPVQQSGQAVKQQPSPQVKTNAPATKQDTLHGKQPPKKVKKVKPAKPSDSTTPAPAKTDDKTKTQ
jgi:hypothetical protein